MHILCKHKSVFMIMLHFRCIQFCMYFLYYFMFYIGISARVISDAIFLVSFSSYIGKQVPSSAYSLLILSHRALYRKTRGQRGACAHNNPSDARFYSYGADSKHLIGSYFFFSFHPSQMTIWRRFLPQSRCVCS